MHHFAANAYGLMLPQDRAAMHSELVVRVYESDTVVHALILMCIAGDMGSGGHTLLCIHAAMQHIHMGLAAAFLPLRHVKTLALREPAAASLDRMAFPFLCRFLRLAAAWLVFGVPQPQE